MADELYWGRPVRIPTMVDNYGRESLALRAGFRLTGDDVVEVLKGLVRERGVPASLRVDNGLERNAKAMAATTPSHLAMAAVVVLTARLASPVEPSRPYLLR